MSGFVKELFHVFEVSEDCTGGNPCALSDLSRRGAQHAAFEAVQHGLRDGGSGFERAYTSSVACLVTRIGYCHAE